MSRSVTKPLNQAQVMKLQKAIQTAPEDVVGKYYFQRVQSIMYSAVDVQKNYIMGQKVSTPTGAARKARGGNGPGRWDSGTMKDAVKYDKGKKLGKYRYEHKIGWLDGSPLYAFFQEHGTKNGVVAMNSLEYTMNFIQNELRLEGLKK